MAAKQGGGAERRWRALIREQESSDLSVGEFARRRGVSPATLYWLRSHLSRVGRQKRTPKLVVLGTEAADACAVRSAFELELKGGRRLRVPSRFDAEALSRLIAAVERAC